MDGCFRLVLATMLIGVLCSSSCGGDEGSAAAQPQERTEGTSSSTDAASAGDAASAAGSPGALTFHKKVVTDEDGFRMEAFRVLVPTGWRFQGGVSWDLSRFPAESSTSYTITSPDGRSKLEQLPHANYFWSEDQNMQMHIG